MAMVKYIKKGKSDVTAFVKDLTGSRPLSWKEGRKAENLVYMGQDRDKPVSNDPNPDQKGTQHASLAQNPDSPNSSEGPALSCD
jgi:hypothetical protein